MDNHVMYHAAVRHLTSRVVLGDYFLFSLSLAYHPKSIPFMANHVMYHAAKTQMSAILHHVTYATTTP